MQSSLLMENLMPLAPELYLTLVAFMLLLFGVAWLKRITVPMLLIVIAVLAVTMFLLPPTNAHPLVVMNGMFLVDGFTGYAKLLILIGTVLTLLISSRWLVEGEGRPFEYLILMLLSVVGMMIMVSAHDMLAVYLGLELSSLALYVLAAFNRDDARASEAGLKYFMLGALASGMMLFGISLVYGFAGSINFETLSQFFAQFSDDAAGNSTVSRAAVIGMVLIAIGFAFKVAAVPFHMWSPDVYEGAPTPVTAFFTMAPNIAAFALFTRVLLQPFGDLFLEWRQIVVVLSALSMAVGALAALRQTNIKRLLAYSSIGHAGFVLMGLAAGSHSGVQAILVYLTLYIFSSAAAFGCVLLMRRDGQYVEQISDLSGLGRTRPWLAFVLAATMFSMAGIPPLAGFFGKLYVVLAAVETGLTLLAVIGMIASVIACYYYLRVVKFMYFDEPVDKFDAHFPLGSQIGIGLGAAVMLLFFLAPGPVLSQARAAAAVLLR